MELQVVKGGIGSIIYRFLLLGIIVQTPPFGGQKKNPLPEPESYPFIN